METATGPAILRRHSIDDGNSCYAEVAVTGVSELHELDKNVLIVLPYRWLPEQER